MDRSGLNGKKGEKMLLHVQYKDFSYQYVDSCTFGKLLANKTHRLFYRPTEERSVNIYHNPGRGLSSQNYYYNSQGKLVKDASVGQSTFEIYV